MKITILELRKLIDEVKQMVISEDTIYPEPSDDIEDFKLDVKYPNPIDMDRVLQPDDEILAAFDNQMTKKIRMADKNYKTPGPTGPPKKRGKRLK